jgi:hypothetical protein
MADLSLEGEEWIAQSRSPARRCHCRAIASCRERVQTMRMPKHASHWSSDSLSGHNGSLRNLEELVVLQSLVSGDFFQVLCTRVWGSSEQDRFRKGVSVNSRARCARCTCTVAPKPCFKFRAAYHHEGTLCCHFILYFKLPLSYTLWIFVLSTQQLYTFARGLPMFCWPVCCQFLECNDFNFWAKIRSEIKSSFLPSASSLSEDLNWWSNSTCLIVNMITKRTYGWLKRVCWFFNMGMQQENCGGKSCFQIQNHPFSGLHKGAPEIRSFPCGHVLFKVCSVV